MLETIRTAWGWIGLVPAEVVAANAFGNLIVRAADNVYWRICPEEWSCEPIAENADDYAKLTKDDEFREDWEMKPLAEAAREKFGQLSVGRCYCLKIPAVLGGEYDADNFGAISLDELIAFSGDMANQIKDLPEGAEIELKVLHTLES
jgi:hypothetical protein